MNNKSNFKEIKPTENSVTCFISELRVVFSRFFFSVFYDSTRAKILYVYMYVYNLFLLSFSFFPSHFSLSPNEKTKGVASSICFNLDDISFN